MSASLNCKPWNWDRVRPNCLRTVICSRAASKQVRAAPIEQAAMLMRPPSSPIMAILKPSPSSPSRLATGTRASSKITCAVGWLFQPSFFSWAPKPSPGVSFGTTRVEIPPAPSPPVRHMTT